MFVLCLIVSLSLKGGFVQTCTLLTNPGVFTCICKYRYLSSVLRAVNVITCEKCSDSVGFAVYWVTSYTETFEVAPWCMAEIKHI